MPIHMIIVVAGVMVAYVYHRKQVEAGNQGIPPLQAVLTQMDQSLGTHLAPTHAQVPDVTQPGKPETKPQLPVKASTVKTISPPLSPKKEAPSPQAKLPTKKDHEDDEKKKPPVNAVPVKTISSPISPKKQAPSPQAKHPIKKNHEDEKKKKIKAPSKMVKRKLPVKTATVKPISSPLSPKKETEHSPKAKEPTKEDHEDEEKKKGMAPSKTVKHEEKMAIPIKESTKPEDPEKQAAAAKTKEINKPKEPTKEVANPEEDAKKSGIPEDANEVVKMEDLVMEYEFQPARPAVPVKKKKKLSANMAAALAPINMADDDDLGNPMEGQSFPAPADVQAILRKRIPEIIANYENLEIGVGASKAPSGEERIKMDETTEEKDIPSDFESTGQTLRSVRSKMKNC